MQWWPFALLLFALPVSAQDGDVNTLYLSPIREADRAPSTDCPELPTFAITHEAVDGKAYAAPSYAAAACSTRFNYAATEDFVLRGQVDVRFWVACNIPTAGGETPATYGFAVLLAQEAEVLDGHPEWQPISQGDTLCTTAPMEIRASIPARDLSVRAGEFLYLYIVALYDNPPTSISPNLHYITGSEYPSSITAQGLPTSQGSTVVRPSANLYLTDTLLSTEPFSDCGDVHTFNLSRTPPPPSVVTAEESYTNQACSAIFSYTGSEPFNLKGQGILRFWYQCPRSTEQDGFAAELFHNGQSMTPPAQSEDPGQIPNVCNATPTEETITFYIPWTPFEVGDTLDVWLRVFALNPAPDNEPFVQFLVGGDTASRLEAEFPWAAPPNATVSLNAKETGQDAPLPMFVCFLAVALAFGAGLKRRSDQEEP